MIGKQKIATRFFSILFILLSIDFFLALLVRVGGSPGSDFYLSTVQRVYFAVKSNAGSVDATRALYIHHAHYSNDEGKLYDFIRELSEQGDLASQSRYLEYLLRKNMVSEAVVWASNQSKLTTESVAILSEAGLSSNNQFIKEQVDRREEGQVYENKK